MIGAIQGDRLDGFSGTTRVSLFHMLQCRARFRLGKACGPDALPHGALAELINLQGLRALQSHFNEMLQMVPFAGREKYIEKFFRMREMSSTEGKFGGRLFQDR